MLNRYQSARSESGNVLFLILIAVALFAALSYAVTQSTRVTGANGDSSATRIHAAAIVQYPAGVRTAVMRMIIDGTAIEELEFNSPSDFGTITAPARSVFHPDGGNATYQTAAHDMMANGAAGRWYFNAAFEIDNIGSEFADDFRGNDIIAFLPGLREGICHAINKDMGLNAIPAADSNLSPAYTTSMDDGYIPPDTETILGILGGNNTDSLTGLPFGCFRNADDDYVYYHVLVER